MCYYCEVGSDEQHLILFIRNLSGHYWISDPNWEDGQNRCGYQCAVHRAMVNSLLKREILVDSKDSHTSGLSLYLLVEDT